jgi:flagellar hook-associated protein 1 FlgK
MSILSVLNVGARALQTSQLAIDVTGQNITNADVEGYSRKRLNVTTLYAYDSIYGQMGIGAAVVNIERMRNVFIDEQIRKQNTEVGYFTEVNKSFQRMEAILTEPSDFGVMHSIDEFFNSWQNLSNNPDDLSARTMVLTEANIMVDYFHKTAQELRDLRQQKNDEIPLLLNRVNEITQEVYNLNQEVLAVEAGGVQNANDSRDRRDFILKELAQIIDIDVVENTNGQVTITTCGSVLVAPSYRQQLETTTVTREMPDGSVLRDVGIRFSSTRQDITPTGGQLRGLIDSRDVYIPEYQARLDELALALVTSVNELHIKGYNLNGYSGIKFFDDLPMDKNGNYLLDGAASKIAVSPSITSDVRNIAAASAGQDLRSDGYDIPLGLHTYGNAAVQLYRGVTYPNISDPNELANAPRAYNIISGTVRLTATIDGVSPPLTTTQVLLREGIDYQVDYTNGTFQMLHDGYDDAKLDVKFDYYVGGFKGPEDNANAIAIAELRTKLTMTGDSLGNPTATFAEYVSTIIGRLGLNTNQSASNLETRMFLAFQYEEQQEMVSGVSIDEEMANLVRYQHTYTAAARLITTVDQMLDTLLNM